MVEDLGSQPKLLLLSHAPHILSILLGVSFQLITGKFSGNYAADITLGWFEALVEHLDGVWGSARLDVKGGTISATKAEVSRTTLLQTGQGGLVNPQCRDHDIGYSRWAPHTFSDVPSG